MDESSICELVRGQDRKAFTYLYDNYSPAIFGEILRIVKNKESAEDLLQEVFIAIWQKSHQYDPGKGRLFTWMLSITRNRCIDHLRKAVNNKRNPDPGRLINENEPQQGNKGLEFSILYKNFCGIEKMHMELVRLIYIYGYTYREASKQCEMPIGTVKTILRKFIIKTREKYAVQ